MRCDEWWVFSGSETGPRLSHRHVKLIWRRNTAASVPLAPVSLLRNSALLSLTPSALTCFSSSTATGNSHRTYRVTRFARPHSVWRAVRGSLPIQKPRLKERTALPNPDNIGTVRRSWDTFNHRFKRVRLTSAVIVIGTASNYVHHHLIVYRP